MGNKNGAPGKERRREFQKTFMETGANPVKGLTFVPSAYALRLHPIRFPVCLLVLSAAQRPRRCTVEPR